MAKPRFLRFDRNSRQWRYWPPNDMIAAGIVKRMSLGRSYSKAAAEVIRQNRLIDAYREGKIAGNTPVPHSTLRQVIASYFATERYKRLTHRVQYGYEMMLQNVCRTKVDGREFGDHRIGKITVRMCSLVYEEWLKTGVVAANDKRRVISMIFNYAISLDIMSRNPMKHTSVVSSKPRKIKWSQDHIKAFLATAYGDFKYRNIGLIVHMCYEWCQRVGDIRKLTWDAIDFDNNRVTITQSKRGATVYLPMTKSLFQMLKQQHKDFSFQKYVVPNVTSATGGYRPYAETAISTLVREVKEKAGLPKELQAWDLRRTGITELVEAGADLAQIMQVSGHASPASVAPYLVNTYKGAVNAMSFRFEEFNDATA
jgi:integrase